MAHKAQIGIVGYGTVGQAIADAWNDDISVVILDTKQEKEEYAKNLAKIPDCDLIFVCVNTPFSLSKGFVKKNIDDALNSILGIASSDCPIVIKSAICPMYTKDHLPKDSRILVSPEYLSEANPKRDFFRQRFMIFGGTDIAIYNKVVEYFDKHATLFYINSDNPIVYRYLDAPYKASILKFMENTFLATKVVFMNEWFSRFVELSYPKSDNANTFKEQWAEMMEAFHLDTRMGNSHFSVPGPDGHWGFGGKCLPKDLLTSSKIGDSGNLFEHIYDLNVAEYRKEAQDWLENGGVIE